MVPVYDKEAYEVANELYHFIIKIICQDLIESLEVIRNENRLLATLHQVN